ncbi:Glutathione S-transferase epsilon 6, partial [Operophtera brumata]
MVIVVHKLNGSPPARAVLMTVDILGMNIETQEVNTLAGDQYKPEFLEKNPLHTIPVLEDGDFIVADSHAILTYLVSKYGAEKRATYYPSDLRIRATVDQRLFFDATHLFPKIRSIVISVLKDGAAGPTPQQIAEVKEVYGFVEKYLERSPFIATDHITIADISCVSSVSTLDVFVSVGEEFPKLREWWEKLQAQEWYEKANVPGLTQFASLHGSPPARSVLMTVELLGLQVQFIEVNLLNREQHDPKYLQKNPTHTVPLLEEDNFILPDSHAIITYLVSKYGHPQHRNLYPEDLKIRAIINQRLFFDASLLYPKARAIGANIFENKATGPSPKQIEEINETYGFMEKYLSNSKFLVGDDITLADISCVASISSLNVFVPIGDKFVKLKEWLKRIAEEEWYQKAN